MPIKLTDISSAAWEHAADRAALNSLRALPGFDEVVRKVAGFFGEKGVRQLFLANAVRVGPNQRPQLYALYKEVLDTMDWPVEPQLYVSQTPLVNAAAVGFDKPFIVLNSGMLSLLDREEQRNILGHELGHIMSGHTTYTTIAIIILTIGLNNLPFLAGIALLPFQLALLEWYRKAELSADRAGLLSGQDPQKAFSTFLKLAGGGANGDDISVDAFIEQASEYETSGDLADRVWQVINTAFRTHPFGTVRAAELKRWIDGGEYQKILNGDYRRRSDAAQPPLAEDITDAAVYYREQAKGAFDALAGVVGRARDAFNSAFNTGADETKGNGNGAEKPTE
jgi:Zn-dependent protease with chaperone function